MTSLLRKRLTALIRCSRGAAAVEYGLILAMIVLGAFAALNGAADKTIGLWTSVDNRVAEVM